MGHDTFAPIDLVGVAIMATVVIVWFCLCGWFFHRLPRYDPATSEWLGSPSLFWDKPRLKTLRFLRFLSSSQWKQLTDPTLVKICLAMRLVLYIYAILIPCLVVFLLRSALL